MKQAYLDFYADERNKKDRLYNPRDKNGFDVGELESFLKRSLNTNYLKKGGRDKIDLEKLEWLIVQAADTNAIDDRKDKSSSAFLNEPTKRALDNDFLARYRVYGFTDDDLHHLINKFIRLKDNPGLREWAIQRRTLLKLETTPLDLAGTSIDGREIDLKRMKGKVVLVDFWSTWCSSCIARMPAIAAMYHRYKSAGFEVVSVSLNGFDKLVEVKEIEEQIGAGWPTLLIEESKKESLGDKIMQKYGFYGVPQLLLLDKAGKLVMLNDVLRDGNFEPLLLTLLKSK